MALTTGRVVRQSVWFHRSMSIAVALGVAASTAVICGALLVGDSMRGSLKTLTLQRLGKIDAAVIPGGYFDAGIASEVANDFEVVPVIQFARGVVESTSEIKTADGSTRTRRSGDVQIVASTEQFWKLDSYGIQPSQFPVGEEIVLNQALADELGVEVGQQVTVRLPAEQAVPADSPLGSRDSESEGIPRLNVVAIVPNEGLGRFSLQPSQSTPLCAFMPLALVREVLERPNAANTLLVNLKADALDLETQQNRLAELSQQLAPGLSDFGLQLKRVTQKFPEEQAEDNSSEAQSTIFDYYSLSSERLLIGDPIADVIQQEFSGDSETPVLTYLANAIETSDGSTSVPYSTISAVDATQGLPLNYQIPSDDSELVPIVLNSWVAEALSAGPGDTLKLFYYEPETTSGKELERSFSAIVSDVVPITKPSKPYRRTRPAIFDEAPTVYNDPDLTPTVPGVTDQDSINDWDLPFELERETSQADDDYWADYRLTPKAFIPLEAGQRLFGSRFGAISSFRISANAAENVESLKSRIVSALRKQQSNLGFSAIPVKAQQLAASRGTTPFDALFLSLSFFVIVAALMLVSLLFRLGMEQRAAEYGTMMATGIPGPKVARMALAEGSWIAVIGAAVGVAGGIAYAKLVLIALKTLWVGAVTVPFLQYHWSLLSIVGGFSAGVLMAVLTILLTTRKLRRAEIRSLLSGTIPESKRSIWNRRWVGIAGLVCIAVAVGLGIFAITLSGPAQAGAFVGGGMLLLCGALALNYNALTSWARQDRRREIAAPFSVGTLSLRSVGRNPLRSTLSIGLMAVACFLIVSMSAFQMRPTERGIGGFDLMGQSAVPLYKDIGDPQIQKELLGRTSEQWSDAKIFGLRFRPGQEASCNNLYQATQPQVLGVGDSFVNWFATANDKHNENGESSSNVLTAIPFDWAAKGVEQIDSVSVETPWQLLQTRASGTATDPVPVILDQNTAMWSLQMRGGVGEVRGFTFDDGQERFFKVVALLGNTTLQGSLVIGEENFESLFPAINGYSYFLAQLPAGSDQALYAQSLEDRLGDIGMDMQDSRTVLANLMAVQNTYLRTFQSLGALGLLLGTFGLAVVQLRNVLDRRGELALLRAIGFSRRRLALSVLAENSTLLLAGIGCGAGAALAAVIPYFVSSKMTPSLLEPLAMLAIVLAIGLIAALISVSKVLRMRLLDSL